MRAAAGLVCALLLTACATTRDSVRLPELGTWDDRLNTLSGLNEWEFRGRIAVKAGDDGFNGRLRWIQDNDSFSATVGGPIGIGTVRIAGNGASVVLTDKDGVDTELDDAELDMRYRYGWTIPVQSLRFWALGIPDPALPAEKEFNEEGQLVKLAQRGWAVTISRYRLGGGQLMPNRLTASNADTRVRIVIDNWRFFD